MKYRAKKAVYLELGRLQARLGQGLAHAPDARSGAFDLVQSREKVGYQLVSPDRLDAVEDGQLGVQGGWVGSPSRRPAVLGLITSEIALMQAFAEERELGVVALGGVWGEALALLGKFLGQPHLKKRIVEADLDASAFPLDVDEIAVPKGF